MLLNVPSADLFYLECDWLVFNLPKAQDCPVPISPKCGNFRIEQEGTTNIMSIGIKSYCMPYTKGRFNML